MILQVEAQTRFIKPPLAPMTTAQPPLNREDDLTQECKDLLASLPKHSRSVAYSLYQYQGVWLLPRLVQSVLAFQQHFQAQDIDIIVASFPKSGTTWLKAITFSILNRSSYSNAKDHPLHSHNPHSLVQNFEFDLYLENPSPDLTSFPSPRLFSTHLPFGSLQISVQESASKVVYICRNPKDTFVSYWQFSNKLRPQHMGTSFEVEFDKLCDGVNGFGPVWDHVLGYWNESLRRPEKVFFLKYEDLKEQPSVLLRRLAKFLGCPFSPKEEEEGIIDDIIELCSFDKLSNLEANKEGKLYKGMSNRIFFRRGEIGDWKNYLTDEMVDRIDKIIEEKFSGSGLKF